MRTSQYYRFLKFTVIIITLLIAVISIVLVNSGPRVRFVESDDIGEMSLTQNSSMIVRFDRPIQDKDYTNQISFSPEVRFTAKTNPQSIVITLNQNLGSQTKYELTIGPEVYDSSGNKMKEIYKKELITGTPKFAYLERNYSSDGQESEDDNVVFGSPDGEKEVVFTHPEITMFAANDKYLIVACNSDVYDELFVVDLDNNETRKIDITLGGDINNLVISPRGKVALFTLTPDSSRVSQEYFDQYSNRVESLNLETGEMTSLLDENDNFVRAISIEFDSLGQAALIQNGNQEFFAVSPFNDYDPILIGTHTSSFGFSSDSSEIIFRNGSLLVLYDVPSGDLTTLDFEIDAFIQNIDSSDQILMAKTSYTAAEITSTVSVFDSWENTESQDVWKSVGTTSTLVDMSASYDQNWLGIQESNIGCSYDTLSPNIQCDDTTTQIYDVRNNETIEEFKGFNLVWIP